MAEYHSEKIDAFIKKMQSDMEEMKNLVNIRVAQLEILIEVSGLLEKKISELDATSQGTPWTSSHEEMGAADAAYYLRGVLKELQMKFK